MANDKKKTVEFRYYDLPQKEYVLALLGEKWVRKYGDGITYLHFHNLMEIGVCRDGEGTLTIADRDYTYHRQMISVLPGNLPHTTNSEKGRESAWEYLFISPETLLRELYPENEVYRTQLLQIINRKAVFGDTSDYPQLTLIVNGIMEEMREKKKYYVDAVHGLLRSLVFEIARINEDNGNSGNQTGTSNRISNMASISRALDYISVNFREPIRVEELAMQSNMSETHFRRIFTDYFQMTPVDYINMVRIQRACELLKTSDNSMNDIAVKCGYDTPSTFNRNFRRLLGVSPYKWKRNPENYESSLLHFHISAEKGW